MRPVLTVGSIDVNEVANHQRRAIGSIVRKNSQLIDHVITPDDIGILRAWFDGWCRAFSGLSLIQHNILNNILSLIFERPVVTIGHAVDIEAKQLAAAADNIDAIAFDGRGGQKPKT